MRWWGRGAEKFKDAQVRPFKVEVFEMRKLRAFGVDTGMIFSKLDDLEEIDAREELDEPVGDASS